jgi:hypothetical protein
MDTCINSGVTTEFVIVFHEFSASFLVETAFREWHNEQALDDAKDVLERPAAGVPVLL